MIRRSSTTPVIVVIAALAALAIPASAFAGNPGVVVTGATPDAPSAVDQVASDVATDGKVDTSSTAVVTEASDSPSTSTYSGGGTSDQLPPPVDCTDTANASSCEPADACAEGSASSSDEACDSAVECEDAAGKDFQGLPCTPATEECSADDTDGNDAKGESCVPEIVAGCTEAVAGGGNAGGNADNGADDANGAADDNEAAATTCGGGGNDDTKPVVEGGGKSPATTPSAVAAGGGGPELPFTGLPLWWTMLAASVLMAIGGGMWMFAKGRKGA